MANAQSTTPREPDINHGVNFMAFQWTMTGIAFIVLMARLYTVTKILKRIRATDYLMIASFACTVVCCSLFTVAFEYGLGRHRYYVDPADLKLFGRWVWFSGLWTSVAPMLGRVSICLFLLGLGKQFKIVQYSLWTCIAVQVITQGFLADFLMLFECGSHIEISWNRLPNRNKCLSPRAVVNALYIVNAFNPPSDLFLTVLPIFMLRGVQLTRAKRILVTLLLSTSVFALVCSLFKEYYVKQIYEPTDPTWRLVNLMYCIIAEAYIIIIVGSIPLLNVLLKTGAKYATGKLSGSRTRKSTNGIMVENTWDVQRDGSTYGATGSGSQNRTVAKMDSEQTMVVQEVEMDSKSRQVAR